MPLDPSGGLPSPDSLTNPLPKFWIHPGFVCDAIKREFAKLLNENINEFHAVFVVECIIGS